jgi:hypothetical protein
MIIRGFPVALMPSRFVVYTIDFCAYSAVVFFFVLLSNLGENLEREAGRVDLGGSRGAC